MLSSLFAYIFLISRLGICMQPTTSGNSATMSLLLMVMLATIFLSAIFFAELFLSFLPPLLSSSRSSATLPYTKSLLARSMTSLRSLGVGRGLRGDPRAALEMNASCCMAKKLFGLSLLRLRQYRSLWLVISNAKHTGKESTLIPKTR